MVAGAWAALGRVAGTYGIRGGLRIESWTRPIENLLDYRRWRLALATPCEVRLLDGHAHGRGLVARIAWQDGAPLDDCDRAAELVGTTIEVERSELPPLPDGSYYWTDLIGLRVRGIAGVELGRVESMTENGAQDVMVVVDGENRRLIPFVTGPIVTSVDIDGGVVGVNWAADY